MAFSIFQWLHMILLENGIVTVQGLQIGYGSDYTNLTVPPNEITSVISEVGAFSNVFYNRYM